MYVCPLPSGHILSVFEPSPAKLGTEVELHRWRPGLVTRLEPWLSRQNFTRGGLAW